MVSEARLETNFAQLEVRKPSSAEWVDDMERLSVEQASQSNDIRGLCDLVFVHAEGDRRRKCCGTK